MLDLLVDMSGEAPLLARCSACSKPEVGRGCLSGSGDVAADDRQDDAREEVGLGILDPGGLVSVRLKITGDMLFSAPAAVDTCELGEIGLLGVEDLEATVGGKETRGSLG